MKISRRSIFAFCAAAIALIGTKGNAMEKSASSIVADAKQMADWIANALTTSGYKADFTLESFTQIDRFFDEHAPNGNIEPGGPLSEQLGARLFAIGAYVGETIIRQIGGEWIGDDNDPAAEINISIKLKDGSIIWPVQRVMKRFDNGSEDSIHVYGIVLKGEEN